jgi:hypothetical protein
MLSIFQGTSHHTLERLPFADRVMTPISAQFLSSTNEEVPLAIQLVMAISSPAAAMTMGEYNNKVRADRFSHWIFFLFLPAIFLAVATCATIDTYRMLGGFSWWLPTMQLAFVHLAVVVSAMGHLRLFVPRAPMAVWEALKDIGMLFSVVVTSSVACAVLLFDQLPLVMITLVCLVAALDAAFLAFWLCVVRTFAPSPVGGSNKLGEREGRWAIVDGLACIYSQLLVYAWRLAL